MFDGAQPKTLAPWPSPSLASATLISVPPTANGVEKLELIDETAALLVLV